MHHTIELTDRHTINFKLRGLSMIVIEEDSFSQASKRSRCKMETVPNFLMKKTCI